MVSLPPKIFLLYKFKLKDYRSLEPVYYSDLTVNATYIIIRKVKCIRVVNKSGRTIRICPSFFVIYDAVEKELMSLYTCNVTRQGLIKATESLMDDNAIVLLTKTASTPAWHNVLFSDVFPAHSQFLGYPDNLRLVKFLNASKTEEVSISINNS